VLGVEILRIAFAALRANNVRALLTMLGIIIGVAAVITMTAVGQGAQVATEERIISMGLDRLNVWGGQRTTAGGTQVYSPISPEDAAALSERMSFANAVVPEYGRSYQVKYRNANAELQVVATVPSYFEINDARLEHGRFFNSGEAESQRLVVTLNTSALEALDTTPTIVGEYIRIQGISFQVVGIVDIISSGSRGGQPPDIFAPLSTIVQRVERARSVNISVQATSESDVIPAAEEIERILRAEHRLKPGEPNDFRIFNRLDLAETFEATARTFSMLLASIAAVSLLVGGIGIMNIMLVSVTERTREIGIRKAIGAKRSIIMLQFLLEAIVLCVSGGIVGIMVGGGGAFLLAEQAGWTVIVTLKSVLLAVAFAFAIGVFFGMYPAVRAARLNPIDALQHA
jgi:putative ABC transport system permease protein